MKDFFISVSISSWLLYIIDFLLDNTIRFNTIIQYFFIVIIVGAAILIVVLMVVYTFACIYDRLICSIGTR